MNRVPGWAHVLSTFMVAFGTTLSAFWILALNSWMHTPTGHVTQGTVLIAGSWLEVIFNPSFPYRFVHMLLASGLTRHVPGRRALGVAPAQGGAGSGRARHAAPGGAHRRGCWCRCRSWPATCTA